ncbi:NADPH-dependent FMN reductase [Bacillus toyonensis]|nr:NADPH-dependent FMN reductase [Bacillus toyonensis]PEL58749.1 NADPH-dependent FMN reductase [Bacillus toyonensis]
MRCLKMKHVLAYVGSRNPDSKTRKHIERLLQSLSEKYKEEISHELLTPNDIQLSPSTGCKNCFKTGKCSLDKVPKDEGELLKRKLLEADFIILASPVYSHNVSSDMKMVIDRLSYWAHLFKLVGKSSIVLAAAESNGVNFVADYLEKVAYVLGLHVVDKIGLMGHQELTDNQLDFLTESIYNHVMGIEKPYADEKIEATFQALKRSFLGYPQDHAEYVYWKESGMFAASSYQEYLDNVLILRQEQIAKKINEYSHC